MIALENQQRLFMVESDQLYRAWKDAFQSAKQYRYGMKWLKKGDREYLVRLQDRNGNGRSLGPSSEETRRIFDEFQAARTRSKERYEGLSSRLDTQARLNRALRLGRLPNVIARVLQELVASDVSKDFTVVGTHAIYGYEAMANVHCRAELLASGDVDLLYDARKSLRLMGAKLGKDGLLGLLRRVDKTFAPMRGDGDFRAVNKDGFMVDLLIPSGDPRQSTRVSFGHDDLVAVEVPNLHWLSNSPKHSVVAIASSGMPVLMRVPDPRAYALHKAWLSQQPDRDPAKKPRDMDQAVMVTQLILNFLPSFPFEPRSLRYFTADMLEKASGAISAAMDDDVKLPSMRFE